MFTLSPQKRKTNQKFDMLKQGHTNLLIKSPEVFTEVVHWYDSGIHNWLVLPFATPTNRQTAGYQMLGYFMNYSD